MENLKHSPVLFTTDDGMPMQFNISSRMQTKYKNLHLLIEHGGGIVENDSSSDIFNLVENETKILNSSEGQQFVKVQFVFDCVAANILHDINEYMVNIKCEDVSDISDKEEEISINSVKSCSETLNENDSRRVELHKRNGMINIKKEENGVTNRSLWSEEEDRKVIDFILKFSHDCGPKKKYLIYKIISDQGIVNRSSNAIGHRMHYIINNIKNYDLTGKEEENLIKRLSVPKKREFTRMDDLKMINYIIKYKYYKRVTGKTVYIQMVKDKVIKDKHPMAMYKRFVSKILPNLDNYDLLPSHVDKFMNRKIYEYFSSDDAGFECEIKSEDEDNAIKDNKSTNTVKKKKTTYQKTSVNNKIKQEFRVSEKKLFKVENIDPDLIEKDDDFLKPKLRNIAIHKTQTSKKRSNSQSTIKTEKSVDEPVKRKKLFDLSKNNLENVDNNSVSIVSSKNNGFDLKIENISYSTTKISIGGNDQTCKNSKLKITSENYTEDFEIHTQEVLNNEQKKKYKWYDTSFDSLSFPDTANDVVDVESSNCCALSDDMCLTKSTDSNKGLEVNSSDVKSLKASKTSGSSETLFFEPLNIKEEKTPIPTSDEQNLALISDTDEIIIPDTYDSQRDFHQHQNIKKEGMGNSSVASGDVSKTCENSFYKKANAILESMKPVISTMKNSDEQKNTLLKYVNELHQLLYENKLREQINIILNKGELSTEDKCILLKYAACQKATTAKVILKNNKE